jgi:hypothetical protein
LDGIDRTLDLDTRVANAVAILQQRLNRVFGLVYALGFRQPPDPAGPGAGKPSHRRPRPHDRALETSALAAVLAPDIDRLAMSPDRAATTLSALVLALNHPMLRGDCGEVPRPDPHEIADIFLHGVLASSRTEGA